MARGANLRNAPVGDIVVQKNGKLTPVTRPPLAWYGGKGIDDVRTISGHFLLSLQRLWEEEGDGILKHVAAQHPELIFSGMVKLMTVMPVEVGPPGDSFSKLGSKQAIVEKLEEMAGPKARALFEKFVSDFRKLRDGDNSEKD
jgi:hypothetical protein